MAQHGRKERANADARSLAAADVIRLPSGWR